MHSILCLPWPWLMSFLPLLEVGVSPMFSFHCACQYLEDSKSPLTLSSAHTMDPSTSSVFLPLSRLLIVQIRKVPWCMFTYLFFRCHHSFSGFYRLLLGLGHHFLVCCLYWVFLGWATLLPLFSAVRVRLIPEEAQGRKEEGRRYLPGHSNQELCKRLIFELAFEEWVNLRLFVDGSRWPKWWKPLGLALCIWK